MGHNATVVVMLDSLHAIEKDLDFGKNLADAIQRHSRVGRPHVDVMATGGNIVHANAATVVCVEHADEYVPIIVGGNTGHVLPPETWGFWSRDGAAPYEPEFEVALMKRLAEKNGFRVSKKRPKKKPEGGE